METSLINSCPGMVFVGMIRFSRCLRIQARKAFHVFINGRLTVFTQTVYASKCNKRQIQPFWKRYRAWTRWLLGLFPSYLNVVWNDKIYKFYKIILEPLFEEINAKEIIAVKDATYAVAKRKPGKKFRLAGIRTLTSAIQVQHCYVVYRYFPWAPGKVCFISFLFAYCTCVVAIF